MSHSHWTAFKSRLGRRHHQAQTHEPGDLPVAVVFRAAGVRRTKRDFPIDDHEPAKVAPRPLRLVFANVRNAGPEGGTAARAI